MATILMVCTGNICRSPMAEGLARRLLEDRGVEDVQVVSAGVKGWEGEAATEEAVEALRELDVDISRHVARRLTRRTIDEADLIVAMAGEHRDSVRRIAPEAAARTFTIKELVRLLEADGTISPTGRSRERIHNRAAAAHAGRSGIDEATADEDVADPLGLGLETYRATAWELQELTARLIAGLLGQRDRTTGSPAREGGAA